MIRRIRLGDLSPGQQAFEQQYGTSDASLNAYFAANPVPISSTPYMPQLITQDTPQLPISSTPYMPQLIQLNTANPYGTSNGQAPLSLSGVPSWVWFGVAGIVGLTALSAIAPARRR